MLLVLLVLTRCSLLHSLLQTPTMLSVLLVLLLEPECESKKIKVKRVYTRRLGWREPCFKKMGPRHLGLGRVQGLVHVSKH